MFDFVLSYFNYIYSLLTSFRDVFSVNSKCQFIDCLKWDEQTHPCCLGSSHIQMSHRTYRSRICTSTQKVQSRYMWVVSFMFLWGSLHNTVQNNCFFRIFHPSKCILMHLCVIHWLNALWSAHVNQLYYINIVFKILNQILSEFYSTFYLQLFENFLDKTKYKFV